MDDQPASNNKAKIIAACVVIAAIAIIYIMAAVLAKDTDTAASATSGTAVSEAAPETAADSTAAAASGSYRDGTYSASGSYRTPETTETIDVTLTVKDGVVTASSVRQTPQDRQSEEYQASFRNNYKPLVVGKSLDEINLSRVSGSSLTSIGFNKALEQIKTDAES